MRFGTLTVIKRQSGSNNTLSLEILRRRGGNTHFFEANHVKVLRKYIMEGHIENGSERRTKIRIKNFIVLAENDKAWI